MRRHRGSQMKGGREMAHRMPRGAYADIYGPTTGDRVRLGDTSLVLQVERDFTVYGDECKFGGGKVLREGMGKAGNPDVMAGVTPGMVVGVTTEAIAGEGMIVTAGGIDSHIHYICPQQAYEAIASGVTTFIGGGTGPATGTCATTCTPGSFYTRAMLQA